MANTRGQKYRLALGLGFLAPNILGFLAFTLVPLVFSLVMAFSNWDLRRHNMFRNEPLRFVGLENFVRLFHQPAFWRFLGNTLFLMMGIPVSIAGSLALALLLSRDLRIRHRKLFIALIAVAMAIIGLVVLLFISLKVAVAAVLMGGLFCVVLLLDASGGTTIYRTLLYLPHFTAGVATILLWKNLYNPHVGPINNFLRPILDCIARVVNATPGAMIRGLTWLCVALLVWLLALGLRRIRLMWADGDLGWVGAACGCALILLPSALAPLWAPQGAALVLGLLSGAVFLYQSMRVFRGREFPSAAGEGFGNALMFGSALMACEWILLGLGILMTRLPAMAAAGLEPPGWHTNFTWAKPAMIFIGLWAALGSNNMLLYLAGLSNVPADLYDAASIDGASGFQRFWNITWPQLAPTTFFIVIMSVIGGLQGGFEMARALSLGGPDGATTTLSYFIYTEGFETGRLGYSSAVAWTLFLMVFVVTLFNWKFGSRYVDD